MATTISALPSLGLNPAIGAQDLHDLEVDFRATFNFMLDADETDRNVRDAARGIIARFLEELKAKDLQPRQALLDFATRTGELFESATGRMTQVRAASAKCLLEMWAERTRVLTPGFQRIFRALKSLGTGFPRPDLFEYACFRALIQNTLRINLLFLSHLRDPNRLPIPRVPCPRVRSPLDSDGDPIPS